MLRIYQRREFRQHHLRDGLHVALALQHAGEAREVRLQPVLLGVLLRRLFEVEDHLVDVVLQRRHLALGFHGD